MPILLPAAAAGKTRNRLVARHVHGTELDALLAGPNGRIVLAELPRLGFVRDLQDHDTEGASSFAIASVIML